MISIDDKLILKRKVYLQSGQQSLKTFKVLECLNKSQKQQIYNIFDQQINKELTLKIIVKSQQLSKQKSINQIKNHQMFVGLSNFVSLYEIYQDQQNIYLVMEKWGQTLQELMQVRGTLTQYEAQLIFSQLVDIIVELRKRNIAHNFITLESLYVDVKEKHRVKLRDFSNSFNVGKCVEIDGTSQNIQAKSNQTKQPQYKPIISFIGKNTSKQQAQKQSPYTCPEQVSIHSKQSQDYASYLSILYEKDVWAVGVILYKLLMGRFPFDSNDNEEHDGSRKFNFQFFNEENNAESETVSRNQCSFAFYQRQSKYCEPISLQFKQLIKSLLKPIHKRIKLKDLINHPLKLRDYNNVRDINFEHQLPPLMFNNLSVFDKLKPFKSQVCEKYLMEKYMEEQRDLKAEQNQCQGKKKRNLLFQDTDNLRDTQLSSSSNEFNSQQKAPLINRQLKYITPCAQFSTFLLFSNENEIPLSRVKQSSEKYFYTWDLNFSKTNELQSIPSINATIQQNQIDNIRTNVISPMESTERQQSPSARSGNKVKNQINIIDNYKIESEDNERLQEKQNGVKRIVAAHKRVPSAIKLKRQVFTSVHNSIMATDGFSKVPSSTNFNIRSINGSKKSIMGSTVLFQRDNRKSMMLERKDKVETVDQFAKSQKPNYFQTRSANNSQYLASQGMSSLWSNGESDIKQSMKKYQLEDGICQQKDIEKDRMTGCAFSKDKKVSVAQDDLLFAYQRDSQELILRNHLSQMPLLAEEPQFVLQYKFNKQSKALGYVLNNSVGVIYETRRHVMGHNQNDYILINKQSNLKQNQKLSTKLKPNKTIRRSSYSSPPSQSILSQEQQVIFNDFINVFGKRMVVSNFACFIQGYWRDGRVFVFLLNNGSWQVTFEGRRVSKFFIVDQNQLIWAKAKNTKPEILNQVRRIVEKKRRELMEEKYFLN